jgi:hypothetical protein
MAQPYEVNGDHLYSDSEDEYEEAPRRTSSPSPALPNTSATSTTSPVVRRFASNFPSFGHRPEPVEPFANPRPSVRGSQASKHPSGPRIHPDRLANFTRNRPPVVKEPARHPFPRQVQVEPLRAAAKSNAASILPDDDLKDEVLAATSKLKAADAPRRRRPSTRKRRLETNTEESSKGMRSSSGSGLASRRDERAGLGQFGDLRSLAAGSLALPDSKNGDDISDPQARPLPQDVYREATLTKKLREQEARREAEDLARIDDEVRSQRQAERQERRIRAPQMRKHRTVSAAMRDNYELEQVEAYLFDDEKSNQGSLKRNLNLALKDLGTDTTAEELWTIVIEVI